MSLSENLHQTPRSTTSLAIRMLIGGGIALAVIAVFVFGAGEGKPEWGNYWMVKPLLLTPLIGAFGGAYTYIINRFGLNRALTFVLSIIGFFMILWVGIVLGLNGTMWD